MKQTGWRCGAVDCIFIIICLKVYYFYLLNLRHAFTSITRAVFVMFKLGEEQHAKWSFVKYAVFL